MTTATSLIDAVRAAWGAVPAPPAQDLQYMEWGWGAEAARTFVGVAPVQVDLKSVGFHAATPLFDLPPAAAAAYLGTYLLSLVQGLDFQHQVGIFSDLTTRAHTLACLQSESFCARVISTHLTSTQRAALSQVVDWLVAERTALALPDEAVSAMVRLSAD